MIAAGIQQASESLAIASIIALGVLLAGIAYFAITAALDKAQRQRERDAVVDTEEPWWLGARARREWPIAAAPERVTYADDSGYPMEPTSDDEREDR